MSSDSPGAATRHADAVIEESAPEAGAASSRDLADLAAAIERLAALMASEAAPEADGSAAVERIADIAFVLHERAVEPSLCDALDAAVRDISGAGTLKQASAQRTQEAAELLAELSRRVTHMMALAEAEERAAPAEAAGRAMLSPAPEPIAETTDGEEAAADDERADEVLFAADLPEDDEFARVVAALAGPLPASDDAAEPASDLQPGAVDIAAQPPDRPQPSEPAAQEAGSASVTESDAEPLASDADVEMTLVIESNGAASFGELSAEFPDDSLMPPNLTEMGSSAEASAGEEHLIAEMARKQPSDDVSSVLLPSLPVEEGRADAGSSGASSSETEPNEASLGEDIPTAELAIGAVSMPSVGDEPRPDASDLPAPGAVPARSSENLSAPKPEEQVELADEAASTAAPLAGEGGPEPQPALPGEAVGSAQWHPLGSADVAIEQHVDHDDVQRDIEHEGETQVSYDPVGAEPVGAADRAEGNAANAGEIFQPVPAEPSRPLLPEPQAAIDPDEDPGDLFEPIANTPAAVPLEAMPQPSDIASAPEPIPPSSSENELKLDASAPAVMSAPGAEKMSDAAPSERSAPAAPPAAKPDAKPPAPAVPPRVAAAPSAQQAPRPVVIDPLAPLRALSEEETIALFS